jgi:hypothetical protein
MYGDDRLDITGQCDLQRDDGLCDRQRKRLSQCAVRVLARIAKWNVDVGARMVEQRYVRLVHVGRHGRRHLSVLGMGARRQ